MRGFKHSKRDKNENCVNYIHRQNKTALLKKKLLQFELYFLELKRADSFLLFNLLVN